jgi:PKD repeat protein
VPLKLPKNGHLSWLYIDSNLSPVLVYFRIVEILKLPFMYKKLLLVLIIGLGSCSEEELPTPSNLQINANVSADGSGLVTVTATAEDAEYYIFDFGETGSSPVETDDGNASHTYESSGSYTLTVHAHSSGSKFISEEKTITVEVGPLTPPADYSTPLEYAGMTLVWNDEFSGPALDETAWTYEIGTGSNGWGNEELEYYTDDNVSFADGNLIITAKKESSFGTDYTSSRIITKSKHTFKYGRIDVRAKLPEGQGIWPAIWMLGQNIDDVGWPACGEIDIMEKIGGSGRENTVHGTAHWANGSSYASFGRPYELIAGSFKNQYHVFSITWDAQFIRWYVDDVEYNAIDITGGLLSEFHNEYFFILNLAVGGRWPGSPDSSTQFPQQLIVDYIRVFQK